jgi:hypothetical protein
MGERQSAVTTVAATKLNDDLLDLGTAASKVVESFERWDAGEDVSPYAWDRLREHMLVLKRGLKRLELP